ncbi:winged helix-turn-helix transcriptional regulator [Halovivax sp.]|uniref:winged helix-turn-helix transcriptional regulator n=1 Tax=Halovivax sp. TaxID=1935978 RepID=UPI0025B94F65|nr:helix-turn-helix domain-containing protein [Halovivax sp.]
MGEFDGDELTDLPPSAKLVFKVLEYDGPLTQKQIVEESMLSARTVRYALERLQEIGIVDEDIYFADARQSLYRLAEPIAADGGIDDACGAEDACCAE